MVSKDRCQDRIGKYPSNRFGVRFRKRLGDTSKQFRNILSKSFGKAKQAVNDNFLHWITFRSTFEE